MATSVKLKILRPVAAKRRKGGKLQHVTSAVTSASEIETHEHS